MLCLVMEEVGGGGRRGIAPCGCNVLDFLALTYVLRTYSLLFGRFLAMSVTKCLLLKVPGVDVEAPGGLLLVLVFYDQ